MATIIENKAVFLHIPKTGGTWVTDVLGKLGLKRGFLSHKHMDIDRLIQPRHLKRIGTGPAEKPFIFCFVREPLSWYESWFRFSRDQDWATWGREGRVRNYRETTWNPNAMLSDCLCPDFNQTVRNICKKRPGYVTEMFGWYTRVGWTDFVGKQEHLREDLIRVLDQLELRYDRATVLSHPKQMASKSRKVEWDPALRRRVAKLERAAYTRYGYPWPL